MIQAQPHDAETDFIIPRTRKSVYSKFKRLMEKNGIDMTFHSLRHLNASVMLMLGVPDKYAMERGGWSTDNILKSVYQQTYTSERERVDDMIDKYFQGMTVGLAPGIKIPITARCGLTSRLAFIGLHYGPVSHLKYFEAHTNILDGASVSFYYFL